MPKPTIKDLQQDLHNAREIAHSFQERTHRAEGEVQERRKQIEELNRERNWLRQLCAEQSSAIAGYMRSR